MARAESRTRARRSFYEAAALKGPPDQQLRTNLPGALIAMVLVGFCAAAASLAQNTARSPAVEAAGVTPAHAVTAMGQAHEFTVRGELRDEAGQPVRGTVRLVRQLTNHEFADEMENAADGEGRKAVSASESATDGSFELAVPDVGLWSMEAGAPGLASVALDLSFDAGDQDLAPIVLPSSTPLEFVVKDPEGSPIPGALVRIATALERQQREAGDFSAGSERSSFQAVSQVARSDERGVVRFALARGTAQVDVSASGFVPGATRAVAWALLTGDDRTITLVPAALRPVEIVLDGGPLAGAVILIEGGRIPVARTDANGRAQIAVPTMATETNPMPLVVEAPGVHHHTTIAHGTELERVRIESRQVTGVVVDDQGVVIPGVLVWTVAPLSTAVLSDARGHFSLRLPSDLPSPSHRTLVRAGAAQWLLTELPLPGADPRARPGSRSNSADADLKIVMRRAAGLKITVLDIDGVPLPGVRLRARPVPDDRQRYRPPDTDLNNLTDSAGVGVLRPIRDDRLYELIVSKNGFGRWSDLLAPAATNSSRSSTATRNAPTERDIEWRAGLREIEVVLEPGTTHAGWVVDSSDTPVAGAQVEVSKATPDDLSRRSFYSFTRAEPLLHTTTDEEGRFLVRDLPTGRVNVEVRAVGFAPTVVGGVELSERDDDLGTITLEPGLVLEGRVVDENDEAVAGVELRFSGGSLSSSGLGITSDERGKFAITDLSAGSYWVFVGSEEFRQLHQPVELPREGELVVEVVRGVPIPFRVTDGEGRSVDWAAVDYVSNRPTPAGQHYAGRTTLRDGEGVLHGMTAGEFILTVQAGSAVLNDVVLTLDGTGAIRLSGDGVNNGSARWDGERLNFALGLGIRLSGTVVGPDGIPVGDGSVLFGSRNSARITGGRYEIEGLNAGPVTATVRVQGFPHLRDRVEVGRGGDQVHDFVLEAGWTVSGVVVDDRGGPVAGARLGFVEQQRESYFGNAASGVSGETGSFQVAGVATGHYAVEVSRDGFAPNRLDPVEVSGPIEGLEIVLTRGARVFGRVVGLSPEKLDGLAVTASAGGVQLRAEVAHDGSYELSSMPSGMTMMSVGGGEVPYRLETVVVPAEGELEVDFEIGRLTLSGVVLRGGQPMGGVEVMVRDREQRFPRGERTSVDGRFSIRNIDPGEYDLSLHSDGLQIHQQVVNVSGDEDIVLDVALTELRGRVTDASGIPVSGATLRTVAIDAEVGEGFFGLREGLVQTDAEGLFVVILPDLGASQYSLRVEGPSGGRALGTWRRGQATFLELQLMEGAPLVVRWRGNAPDSASVSLVDASGRVVQSTHLSRTWRIAEAPLGTWTLYASRGGVSLTVPATVSEVTTPGEDNVVELTWPETGTIRLRAAASASDLGGLLRYRLRDSLGKVMMIPFGSMLRDWSFVAIHSPDIELPAGSWTLEVLGAEDDAVRVSVNLQVQPGGLIELVVE